MHTLSSVQALGAVRRVVALALMLGLITASFPANVIAEEIADAVAESTSVETPATQSSEAPETGDGDEMPSDESAPALDDTVDDTAASDEGTVDEPQSNEPTNPVSTGSGGPSDQTPTGPVSEFKDTVVNELVTPLVVELPGKVTFFEKVELGVTYTYAGNDQVQVTFTKLPQNPGSLSIEEIILSDEQVQALGAVSDVAYDITSSMENGTFAYDLKLPIPAGTDNVSRVVYADSVDELPSDAVVVEEEKVAAVEDTVVVTDLDHFTIFVVVRTTQEFGGLTWGKDRTSPTGGWSATTDTLTITIDGSLASLNSFYKTEGVKAALPSGKNSVKATLYIDPVWEAVNFVRAGIWGEVSDGSGIAWPIIEFANDSIDPRIRVWNTMVGGWTDTNAPVSYGDSVELEIVQNPFTSTFEFYADGALIHSYSSVDGSDDYNTFVGVILNSFNNGADYTVTWSDLEVGVVNETKIKPALVFLDPAAPNQTYYGTTVPVTVEAIDNESGLNNLIVNIKGADNSTHIGSCGPGLSGLGGTTASTTYSCSIDVSAYPDGTYYLRAGTTDVAGNNRTVSRPFVIATDSTRPTLTFIDPAAPNQVYDTTVPVTVEAIDNESGLNNLVMHVKDTNGNTHLGACGTGLAGLGGITATTTYSCSLDVSGYADGTYYLRAGTTDMVGNNQTVQISFVVSHRQSDIIQPTVGETVFGMADLEAFYADENGDGNDSIQWAVRAGTCAASTNTVFGNVDGKNTSFTWNGADFFASVDTTTVADGEYCFVFNPTEDAGNANQRLTRTFTIDNSGPSKPVIVFPTAEQIFTGTPILNGWDPATDPHGIAMYEIAYAYDDGHTFGGSTCPAVTDINGTSISGCRQTTATERNHIPALSEQGGVAIWVRAFDSLGNIGEWSDPVHYWYDVTGSGPGTPPVPIFGTTTVDVTGNTAAGENQPGWLFNRDLSTQSPYEFLSGVFKIGEGSLFVKPIGNSINGNNDKFIAELFLLEPVAEIDSISYDFNIATHDASNEHEFYASVYMNFGDSSPVNYYDCRYSVVPTTGAVNGWTTVTFDPTQSYPVTKWSGSGSPHTCPSSPASMDASATDSIIRAFAINVGDTSGDDQGVSGYLDNVAVVQTTGTHTQTTIYDFEPTPPSITIGGGGGSSSSSFSSLSAAALTDEEVLGASTECGPPLTSFLSIGGKNDASEVSKLQTFLNTQGLGVILPVTGIFGQMTFGAVKAFQTKYWEDILLPWFSVPGSGISSKEDSTGHVYQTTKWKINDLWCPGSEAFPEPLV